MTTPRPRKVEQSTPETKAPLAHPRGRFAGDDAERLSDVPPDTSPPPDPRWRGDDDE